MAEREELSEERQREDAVRKNSIEPVPHRGEDENLDDVDPEHRNKVQDAYNRKVGDSKTTNDDTNTDTDAGSRHGMV